MKKVLQKISYSNRLYIAFATIIIMILTMSGMFFYHYNFRLLKENMEKNSVESLKLIQTRIEDRLENMDAILKKLHVSSEFTEMAFSITEGNGNYFAQNPRKRTQINNMMLSFMVSESLGTSMHFVSRYYDNTSTFMKMFPYMGSELSKEGISKIDYVEEGLETDEYRIFMPPHDNVWLKDEQYVFSVIRPIRDNFSVYGILEINQEIEELQQLCMIEDLEKDYQIIVTNEEKKGIYDTSLGKGSQEDYSRLLVNSNGMEYEGNETLYVYDKSALTGWSLIMARDLSALKQQANSLLQMIFFSYLIGCLVILGFVRFVTQGLTRPLTQLRDNLYRLKPNQEIHITTPSASNEVTMLASAIEEILNKIRQQNEIIIQTRKRALKAHVDMLEAQMNPHFLYNALSVIGACGYEDGSKRVNTMCNELADLLRYSIRFEHKMVYLSDELHNIGDYLSIMKRRYEEMIQVEWLLDETLDNVAVPKLILQPIVENCFKHAFQNQLPIWKITIISCLAEGKWHVVVKNNGKPFAQEKIWKMQEKFKRFKHQYTTLELDEEAEVSGLGLENIWKRMYMQYGEEVIFDIRQEGTWSVVDVGGVMQSVEGKNEDTDCGR